MDDLTPDEFDAILEGYLWREERTWEKMAWMAYHSLLPWMDKKSRLTPRDLLTAAAGAGSGEAPAQLTKEEARDELAKLMREMGGDSNQ